MTEAVLVHNRDLDDYRPIIGEECIDEIRRLAQPLKGARVLHLNATAQGGGVAEILKSLVPLMNDVGIEAEWRILKGADEFFQVLAFALAGTLLLIPAGLGCIWLLQELGLWEIVFGWFRPFLEALLSLLVAVG